MRQKVTLESSSSASPQLKQGATVSNNGIADNGIPATQKNQHIHYTGEEMHANSIYIMNKTKSIDQRNERGSGFGNIMNRDELSKQPSNMKMQGISSSVKLSDECVRNDKEERYWDRGCDESGKSLRACSRVKENSNNGGPLRYALHLRFVCPFPKKTSRSVHKCRSNSLPEKTSLNMEGERRFYLYNDLRVVFPQRHSDADEGKVCT